MHQDLWINLPVADVERSRSFFAAIGFAPNPGPGNSAQSASFTIGPKKTVLMLFAQPAFASFAGAPTSDATKSSEVLLSFGADSRAEVDAMAQRAREAGGTVFCEPDGSSGFMYGCGFSDPDGHRWNMLYMEPAALAHGAA